MCVYLYVVSEWLEKMFPDLQWRTNDLSADSLCRLDLEVSFAYGCMYVCMVCSGGKLVCYEDH